MAAPSHSTRRGNQVGVAAGIADSSIAPLVDVAPSMGIAAASVGTAVSIGAASMAESVATSVAASVASGSEPHPERAKAAAVAPKIKNLRM